MSLYKPSFLRQKKFLCHGYTPPPLPPAASLPTAHRLHANPLPTQPSPPAPPAAIPVDCRISCTCRESSMDYPLCTWAGDPRIMSATIPPLPPAFLPPTSFGCLPVLYYKCNVWANWQIPLPFIAMYQIGYLNPHITDVLRLELRYRVQNNLFEFRS